MGLASFENVKLVDSDERVPFNTRTSSVICQFTFAAFIDSSENSRESLDFKFLVLSVSFVYIRILLCLYLRTIIILL